MQVVLVMFKSDGERRSFSLPRDITIIGRREDCDLRIPLGEVSRKHCRLIKDGDILKLEDLGSSNGSFHNGIRVQESTVQAGDTVQIGPVVFVVQIEGVPADDDIQAGGAVETSHKRDDGGEELAAPAATIEDLAPSATMDELIPLPMSEDEPIEEVIPLDPMDEVHPGAEHAEEDHTEILELEELSPLDETEHLPIEELEDHKG